MFLVFFGLVDAPKALLFSVYRQAKEIYLSTTNPDTTPLPLAEDTLNMGYIFVDSYVILF